jgi:hypothetical protein
MTRRTTTAWLSAAMGAALIGGMFSTTLLAQRATPAEVAAKLSGNWRINLDLSPQFRPANPGRQGSAGTAGAPLLSLASPRSSLAFLQRGGGPAAAPDPRMMAGNRAIQTLQQAPAAMTIAATAESVTLTDPRGARTYALDNKEVKQDVGSGATITTKSRLDNHTLRQEFIFDETKVTHAFEVNNEGTRITFTMRIDNFSGGAGRQVRGIYEKQ